MRKRVLSVLLTMALCLTLLPTAAFAEGGTSGGEGAASVASVTIDGVTTEYSNIFRAFESVEKASSATITLLDNVYLPADEDERFSGFPTDIEFKSVGSVTLDLNSHTLTHADIGFTDGYTPHVIEMQYGTLTITGNGTIHQRYKTSAISVSSQSTLIIDGDGVTVKADFSYGSHQFSTDSSRAIAVDGGELTVNGGTFTATSGVALEYTKGTVQLCGGTFDGIKIVTYKYPGKINEGVYVTDLLAPGRTYQHTDSTFPEDFYVQTISDVKVVEGLTPVPYVDEAGTNVTATDYTQIEPTTTNWDGGLYVVKGNVTINDNVTVSGTTPSIILCDGASLTVNGGVTLPGGTLTIYGQSGGTGRMTVTNSSGAAFSSGSEAVLRLLRGTLTATGSGAAFSNVFCPNQRGGNDQIKCIKTGSEPEVRADGTAEPSVTLSPCTEHQWSYAQNAGKEMHLRTCALCGYNENGAGVYESCQYSTFSSQGEGGHKKACLCGRIESGAALTAHTPTYSANADGRTHSYRCTDCGFVSGVAEEHHYENGICTRCGFGCAHEDADKTVGSPTEGKCPNCGKQVYEARLVRGNGKVLEYYETVEEALAHYTAVSDPIVTLLCDKNMGDGALVVTCKIRAAALDLGGHTLSGSGGAVFQINQRYGFTLRNGKVENTGKGDAIQLTYGVDEAWGNMASSGNLTVEDLAVTAAKGWAIQVMDDADYADLNVMSGTFNGGLNAGTISGGHKVQIHGGTFIANSGTHSVYYPGTGQGVTGLVGQLKKLLADGWTYGDADGNPINYFDEANRTVLDTDRPEWPQKIYLNAETVTIVEHAAHDIDWESGKCSICGAPCTHIQTDENGLCTACGVRVMFCETEGKLYKTIQAAQETLKDRTDNPVVKLLDNYTGATLLGTANGYTLDLNGFRVTDEQVIIYANRTLTIIDSSEKKTGSMWQLWVDGGRVTIRDGSYAELIASYKDSIRITGEGTMKTRKIQMLGKTDGSNTKVVADLLDQGYAVYLVDENAGTQTLINGYYNKDNKNNLQQYLPGPHKDASSELKDGQYYTVMPHTHSYASSAETACECGKTCDHVSISAAGKCEGCGTVFTAKVTDSAGAAVYYADGRYDNGNTRSGLDAAFEKAAAGSTVTLLGGSTIVGYLDGGKALTLELNGKAANTLYVGRSNGANSLTIQGPGDIGSLYVHKGNAADLTNWSGTMNLLYVYDGSKTTLTGGTVAGFGNSAGTAGSVLAEGRAFQKEDGTFAAYGAALSTLENVTVTACPHTDIQSGHCRYCNKTVAATVNGTAYDDFGSAVSAWLESGGTMTLYKSVENMTPAVWQGGSGKTYTLELNGCTLTAPGDDSGSTALPYQITVTGMELTVQDSSAAADGRIDNLLLSTGSKLTLKSGWLGMLTVPNDDTVSVTLEGGGLKGYDTKVPMAYLLPDGYDLEDVPNLYSSGASELTATVRKAPVDIGGGRTGTMPFGRNLLPFAPTAVPEDGVKTPAKITAAWYQRDGSPLADAEMKPSGAGYVYDSASETAGCQAYDGMAAGGRYDLFMVLTATDETGKELWQAAVTGYELTVGKPTLDDAEIRFTNGSEAVFSPSGSISVPEFTVTLYGETVDKAYYTVSGGNADGVGTYTVTVTGDGTHYAGGTSAPWSVRACKLGEMELDPAATRKYDGTTAAPDALFTGRFRNGENSAQTVSLAAAGYKITEASYSTAEVGGGKTVTYTVELLDPNYVFENGAATQTFTVSAAELLKADAPAAKAGALTITNDLDEVYSLALSGLLPSAPKGGYGAITYGTPTVSLQEGYAGTATVGTDGSLALDISQTGRTVGVIGTVTVTVSTVNYEDITLTVSISAVNKITPQADGTVSASPLTYGQKLSDSTITGTMKNGGAEVPGTFAWQDPDAVLSAGTHTDAAWKFTPTDLRTYTVATGTAAVTVSKAAQSGAVRIAGYVYGETPSTPSLAGKTGDGAVTYYYSTVSGGSGTEWTNIQPTTLSAGTYYMYAVIGETANYSAFTTPAVEFKVEKAAPTYRVPAGLTAVYGQTLADIALPAGWSWMDGSKSVGDASASVKTFGARFTPDDAVNYETLTDIGVGLLVNKADGRNLATIEQSLKFTDTSDHTCTPDWSELPAGQSWTYSSEASVVPGRNDFAADGSLLTYAIPEGRAAGEQITILLKASCNNYEDFTVTLRITLADRETQAALTITGDIAVVYGQTLTLSTEGGSGAGAVTYAVSDGTGKAVIDADGILTPVKAGSVTVTAAKAGDADYNDITSAPFTITITKATPTGEPRYAEITTGGRKLSDAGLSANDDWPAGTVTWVDSDGSALPEDSEVKANAVYKWVFAPDDSDNYNAIEGSVTLYRVLPSDDHPPVAYPVSAPGKTENGSVSAGTENAVSGSTVTITVTPESGYRLGEITVTDRNGSVLPLTDLGGGRFSFTMPTGRVSIAASFVAAEEARPFADVSTDVYYYEAVKWAVENGVTGGIGGGLFGSAQPCTRAQIVTFLWRAAGSPVVNYVMSLSDVPEDAYYAEAVRWALSLGITAGTGDGRFAPNDACTRAQAVTFLARALNAAAANPAPGFTDVAADAYYAEAVAWAVENGVTEGIGSGLFAPNSVCTRAQIVTFLYRCMR